VKQDLLSGQFITMFAAVLDVETRTLTHVCAGHHPSFLASLSRNVVCEKIGNKGPALGLMSGEIFKRALKPTSVQLQPGDTVIMYTDGLTEVHNARNVEYGDFRMMGTLVGNLENPYDEVVAALVRDARVFASGILHDDVTVMSLSIEMPQENEDKPE
jgi:sigma-B regulation protein RsbU (phosphoserine phosphatase)